MFDIRPTIILVDDNQASLAQGKSILKPFYKVFSAPSSAKLFEALEHVIPALILLDVEMPGINGYEAIGKLKADARFADIPVIFLTSKNDADSESRGLALGAADYISKPFSPSVLLGRIAKELLILRQKNELLSRQATLERHSGSLEEAVRKKTGEVLELQNAILAAVADLVEVRDAFTGGHVARTRLYMKTMFEEMLREGLYGEEISAWEPDFFLPSVQLHDVGKIAIPDFILNKPGRLTNAEFEVIKTHVSIGINTIRKIMESTKEHAFLNHTLSIVGTHHEKWDGTGYPAGLKSRDIPLEGRLMAVVDVYDALVSERPYKESFTHDRAIEIIVNDAGRHFDPDLVGVFREVEGKFLEITRGRKEV